MPNPPSVFISYRRKSSVDLAQALHNRLKDAGVDVFFDLDAIAGGEDYELRLEDELEQRDCLLVILAPETLEQSKWVQREIATALRRHKKIIPVTTGGYTFTRETLPPDIADLARYNYIVYEPRYANAAFDAIKHALGVTDNVTAGVGTGNILPTSTLEPTTRSGLTGAALTAVITGIFAVIVALIGIVPKLIESSSPTRTLQPTQIVIPASHTPVLPTATFTPTNEPTLTSPPPSETPSPTDKPTPISPSPVSPVSIMVPTLVLPNTTILVTAWQNAHCVFTSDNGKPPIPFDTSTETIQYSVQDAGVTVSIVCEDVQGRHEEKQFVVSAAAIPTATLTSTITNTSLPPSPIFTPTSTLTNTPLPPTSTFTFVPPTATETAAPPTRIPTPKATVDPCIGQVNTSTGASATYYRQRPPSGSATIRNKTEVLVVGNSYIQSEKRFYYEIRFDNQAGFITVDRVNLSNTCPYFKS